MSPLNIVVFAFWHYTNSESPLFFHHKVSDIRFFITKVCSLHILAVHNLVVSTFWDYKNLQCLLFSLQNIVVFTFRHYKLHSLLFFHFKSWSCPLFHLKKLCSISILKLQNLKSLHFGTTKVCSSYFFRKQKCVLASCPVLDSDEVHVVQYITGAEFSYIALYFVPYI